jgi:hypothetical protein
MKKVFATFIIASLLVCLGANIAEAKPKIKKYSLKSQKKCWKPRGEKRVG